ncbi:MAG: hypothetical protein BGO14_02560 [Chlamydiales bacterium 38-26]|nr:DUF2490 domain-containing protein [Chlamydiales bacterium]OJV09235.1 MAG: hypothetical protein BGO14_02560 [Chlamydiales bacterium 38-26]
MKIQVCLLLLFTFLLTSFLPAQEQDTEYWEFITWDAWKSQKFRYYVIQETRFENNMSDYSRFRLSLNLAYRTRCNLDLEAHLTVIYAKPIDARHFISYPRLELEFNPYIAFDNGTLVTFRNRLELEHRPNIKYVFFVFRHRSMVSFPLKNCGKLVGINIYDEFFYHFDSDQVTQNRFYPLEMAFALNEKVNLNLFVMIREVLRNNEWHRSFVLGSNLWF